MCVSTKWNMSERTGDRQAQWNEMKILKYMYIWRNSKWILVLFSSLFPSFFDHQQHFFSELKIVSAINALEKDILFY